MATRRVKRVAELVRHELSRILLDGVHDPRVGFITVTRVEVSADLRHAKVFLSVMGNPANARTTLRGLMSARGVMRRRLGERVELRRVPELAFHLDEGVKQSIRMSGILSDLARERGERDAGALDEDAAGVEANGTGGVEEAKERDVL